MGPAPGDIRTVRVQAARAYAAHVGYDLLSRGVPDASGGLTPIGHAIVTGLRATQQVSPRRALLVHDEALPGAMVEALARSLRDTSPNPSPSPSPNSSLDVWAVSLRADEKDKSLASVERILEAAARAKLERTDCVVALGGGIVGDLAGFAAATYRRGVAWCNVPTTLLSMVDASIGGKTGCNLAVAGSLLKNMAGSFHDPALVICDTATLITLPPRELVGGLAECVKHAMIEGSVPHVPQAPGGPESAGTLWSRLEALSAEIASAPVSSGQFRPGTLVDLIADNLELKARVVSADPFETAGDGGRALLNLGHTFGHALETMEGLVPRSVGAPTGIERAAPMSHGEGVALGLVAACVAGERLGTSSADLTRRVETLLSRLDLPTRVDNLSPRIEEAIERMGHDKKARGGTLRIIVPVENASKSPGTCGLSRIFSSPTHAALRAAFERLAQ